MEQVLACASSRPTCGLEQEERNPTVWEGPPGAPRKETKHCIPIANADAYMGQMITQAAQLLVPVTAIFVRTLVLLLRLFFPFSRCGRFNGRRNLETTYITRDKRRSDRVLKMSLRTGKESIN